MSTDPQDFDFEALLESTRTLTRTVAFRRADDLAERHEHLERQLRLAERAGDADRGLNDPTPATIRIELEELAREWDERGTKVTVRERTRAQMSEATRHLRQERAAQARKAPADRKGKKPTPAQERAAVEAERVATEEHAKAMLFAQMADALVAPLLTAEQLRTIHESSTVGEKAIDTIWGMVQEVCAVPPVPFSAGPSPSPGGQDSEPS